MANLDKKIYEMLTKPSATPNAGSLAAHIKNANKSLQRGGTVYDAVVGDAAGSSIAADIAVIDGIVDTILLDTAELQTDWVNGGRLDLIIDELTTQGDTNETKIDSMIATTETGESVGTLSYLDAGGEQTILEMTVSTRREIKSVWLDVTALTQDGDWKMYHKIDGSNYRAFDTGAFTVATDSDGILIDGFTINNDWKITWTEDADEGAARNIPYNVIYQELE